MLLVVKDIHMRTCQMQHSCNQCTSFKYELDFYDLIMAFDLIDAI